MSRPGVEVSSAAMAPAHGVPTDTGPCFMVGEALQGPTDKPTRLSSLDEFVAVYGERIPGTVSYDSVDAYFHVGGTVLYFMRCEEGAAAATKAADPIVVGGTLTASSPGAWGDTMTLDVVDTPGGTTQSKGKRGAPSRASALTYADTRAGGAFMATVTVNDKVVQTSQPMDDGNELALFLARGGYMTLTGTMAPLALGSVTLAGGDDGTVPVTDPDAIGTAAANIPTRAWLGATHRTGQE